MIFAWDITIPAGTPVGSPVEQTLKLQKGVITKIEVKFPSGCHGMVRVRLLRYEHMIAPLNRDEWITGDDEAVTYPEYYELIDTPYQLKFVGCSPGTKYEHTVTVRVSILPSKVASLMPLVELFTKFLRRIGVVV